MEKVPTSGTNKGCDPTPTFYGLELIHNDEISE